MVALQPLISEFTIVGRLDDFVVNSKGRVKYLYLSTPEEDYSVEVASEQKNVLHEYLKPGCYLKVTGMQKYKLHQEKVNYKAYRIELLPEEVIEEVASKGAIIPSPETSKDPIKALATTKPKAKVLICTSKTCWQQGGKAAYESLQAELRSQGIEELVEVKTTGCLKQCKQAPNLIMPGRHRCSRVQPRQVSELVANYLL